MFLGQPQPALSAAEELAATLPVELEYKKGNEDVAFEHLRRAVDLDDNLPYDEPWGWMQPTRHALGALLLDSGRYDKAEAVYRADLGLDETLARAEAPVCASCYCRHA